MLFEFGGFFRKVWRGALLLGTLVIGANSLFVAPVSAATGINQQLNFQGRLLNAQGAVVVDGYYNVQFKIYQDGAGTAAGNPGGTLLWTEDWMNSNGNPVKLVNGYMSVQLGSLNPFGNSIDWNQDTIWLSINIGNTNVSCTPFSACAGDGEMTPMKRLSAVPYALNSAKLGGLTAAGFIQNTTTVQTATNMAIDGTARADTSILTPSIDTNTAVALNIGTTNATAINLNKNVVVAANQSLTLTGGTTANRPASPTEGMMFYDTDTKQLLVYANGKWKADGTEALLVAASDSSAADKAAANYLANGNTAAANDGDQVEINNALTAGAGKKVLLLAGTYTVDASISVPNNTTLTGVGAGTVITIPNSFNTNINTITNTTTGGNGTGIVIRDLKIDGNRSSQTSGTMHGVYLNGVGSGTGASALQGGKLSGLYTNNLSGSGIYITSSSYTTISGNTARGNGSAGIRIHSSPNNIVNENTTQGNNDAGISLYRSSNNTIANNTTLENAYEGIFLESSDNNNNTIANNIIRGNSGDGIYASGSYNTFTGNAVQNNTLSGMNIENGSRNTLTGNTIQGNGSAGIMIYTSPYSTITGNTIQGNGSYGISIYSESHYTTVSSNNLSDNGGPANNNAIYVENSDSNTITSNTISDTSATTNYAINIANSTSDTNYLADNTLGGGTVNDAGTGTIYAGQFASSTSFLLQPATNITIGSTSTTTTIQGSLAITPQASTSTTLLCNGSGGIVSTCDSSVLAPSATNFIRNQNAAQQATANFWISGSARSDTSVLTPTVDTATGVTLNIGTSTATGITLGKSGVATTTAGGLLTSSVDTASGALTLGGTNATGITLGQNVTVAAGKNITFAAGAGSFDQSSSTGTFKTGTGAVSLNGDTTVANGKTLTVNGATLIKPTTNTVTAFSVQDAASANVLTVNTTGSSPLVTIGSGTGGVGYVGRVASGTYAGTGSGVLTRTSTVLKAIPTGHTVIGSLTNESSGSTTNLTITDTKGNTYTVDTSVSDGTTTGTYIFSAQITNALAAGDVITLTVDDDKNRWLWNLEEFDSIVSSSWVDRTSTNTGNSTSLTTGTTAATTTANQLVFSTFSYSKGTPTRMFTAGSGYTASPTLYTNAGSADRANANEWKFVTSSGTQVATGTLSNSSAAYTAAIATYKMTGAISGSIGSIGLAGSNGFTGVLSVSSLTDNRTYTLADESGTICLQGSASCGFVTGSAANFIQNQNTAQQATSNFWISGSARADTSLLTPTVDTATGAVLNVGTTNATSITIGKSAITTNLASSTVNVGTSGSSTSILGATQTTNNTDGNSMIIRGSAGLGTGKGGSVTIQGGNAGATSGANGGNLTLSGGTGTGTGVSGLVIINNATYSTSTTQASASSVNVTQANIDSFGAIILNATAASVNFTLTSPTLGANAAGRVIYVTAANGSQDFTLRANVGGGTGVEQNIAMRQNTTATMIWNGSQWTAAGASSSTTLQAAYDNTLQSAGGAELVVSKTGTTNGLTIRDSSSAPVNGTLLSIQTKTASTLLSVNSNVTDYATNGGAEIAFATDWALIPSSGATVSRNTTAANIAVGTGSVSVTTATSANSGARNTLSAALTPGLRYNVSFTAKLSSGNFVDLNVNYSNDGTNANTACTNYSTQAIATSVWTKVNCTFTAPASTSATNAIFIRQTASGTARTFYVDNLSVTIGADQSYATDGDVNDSANFGSNWQIVTGGGTASATRDTDYGYRASDSAKATISTATAGAGIKNKLSINPLATTPGTLYRITAYASSTTAMTDFTIRYSRDNGTSFDACVDYNTQTLSGSASDFKKITCYVTVSSTAASNAWVFFTQGAGAARSIYVDSFSMTIASNTTPNVQVGGGVTGGPTTLFTLDKGASAPIANDNDALLGSMYYDTTLGKLQCYEADGWGACGSSPDTVVTISPEYTNAVLHGTGVGTMTSDICSDTLNINDATNGPVICGTNETYNFYKWTSPQASPQTYSIYVTYQLPSTFKEFASGQTSLMGRTNNANAAVSYRIFRSDENGLTPCSAAVSVSTGVQTSWQTKVASGAADPSTCGFEPGDSVVFQIDMVASTTANAYVSNLNFVFSNR